MPSDWVRRSKLRRDARQARDENVRPPSGSKKDTKRWCRGKVGTEHTPVCVDYTEHKRIGGSRGAFGGWKILVCSTCNRELDYWFPTLPRSNREPKKPPEWVKE